MKGSRLWEEQIPFCIARGSLGVVVVGEIAVWAWVDVEGLVKWVTIGVWTCLWYSRKGHWGEAITWVETCETSEGSIVRLTSNIIEV